jgi:hypothetical protein
MTFERDGFMTLENLKGCVKELVRDGVFPAGTHVVWNGRFGFVQFLDGHKCFFYRNPEVGYTSAREYATWLGWDTFDLEEYKVWS